jgi:hypothetical protein
MHPILDFARAITDEQEERFTKVIMGLPDEALNWQPTASGTNSIAQIIRHVTRATPFLLRLAAGTDQPPSPEQWQAWHDEMWRNDPATKRDLLDMLAAGRAARDEQLAILARMDLSEETRGFGQPAPRMAFVAGVVEHAAEHVGHAELTKQWWEARQGA